MKMFVHVLSLCLFATPISAQDKNPVYERYSKSLASPRVSFSTSIIHSNRDSEDQQAESSINVNFEPQKVTYNGHKPKIGTFNQNDPTHNFFNVGYTMSFENKKPKTLKSVSNHRGVSGTKNYNLDNAEVITGTTKQNEQVTAPQTDNLSPQEFVSHALLKQKHLISGIKPKYPLPPDSERYKTTKVVSSGEVKNFSPKIQQHIKSLEKTKAIEFANHKFKNSQQNLYNSWKNLSPGVEIVKSAEIPVAENSKHKNKFEKTVNQKYTVSQFTKPNFKFGRFNSDETQSHDNNDNYRINEFPQATFNFDPLGSQDNKNSYSIPDTTYKLPSAKNLEAYLSTEVDQLPRIDTTLLREPVLVTNLNNIPKDPNIVPIHFDLRPLEVAMTQQGPLVQSNDNTFMHVYEDPAKRKYNFQPDNSHESVENTNDYFTEENAMYKDTETSQSEHQYSYYGAPDQFSEQHLFLHNTEKSREPRVIKDNKWIPIESGDNSKFYKVQKSRKSKDSGGSEGQKTMEKLNKKEENKSEEKPKEMRYTKVQQNKPQDSPKPEKPKEWYRDKPIVGLKKESKQKSLERPQYRGNHHKVREYNVPPLGYSFF